MTQGNHHCSMVLSNSSKALLQFGIEREQNQGREHKCISLPYTQFGDTQRKRFRNNKILCVRSQADNKSESLVSNQLETDGQSLGDYDTNVTIPNSREDAIEQAQISIQNIISKSGNKKILGRNVDKRGEFVGKIPRRLVLELAISDDTSSGNLLLATDLAYGLQFPGNSSTTGIYFADIQTAELAINVKKGASFGSDIPKSTTNKLKDCHVESIDRLKKVPDNVGIVFVISPKESQLDSVEKLVSKAGLRTVVVVNPGWYSLQKVSSSKPSALLVNSFIDSFEVCYSFRPLAIQVLLMFNFEGALFKFAKEGHPSDSPWLVLRNVGDKMMCVGKLTKRPTAEQLENVMYQAMAVGSPISQSIGFLRSLGGKK